MSPGRARLDPGKGNSKGSESQSSSFSKASGSPSTRRSSLYDTRWWRSACSPRAEREVAPCSSRPDPEPAWSFHHDQLRGQPIEAQSK